MDSAITSLKKLTSDDYGSIPDQENDAILHLSDPMVQSFNYAMGEGLVNAVKNIPAAELLSPTDKLISIRILRVKVDSPVLPKDPTDLVSSVMYPRQCIESQSTYQGQATATVEWTLGNARKTFEISLGHIPIMVKSRLCNLHGLAPAELVGHGEHINDPGGYFIVNGKKKLVRLLTAQRRNYPIALIRETWRTKQKYFTDKGVIIQCIATDETTVTNILHYLSTGFAQLQFIINKMVMSISLPIMLKGLKDVNDKEIISLLKFLRPNDTFFIEKMKQMLVNMAEQDLFTSDHCKAYIGRSFRNARNTVENILPASCTDAQICDIVLKNYVFVHLDNNDDKFNLLCLMACKLYGLVGGECVAESIDVFSMMESQLSGFVFLKYFKELISEYLISLKYSTLLKLKGSPVDFELTEKDMRRLCNSSTKVSTFLKTFVSSGSLNSKSGLGMMQATGLTVEVDGLNRWRDLSHLRAIHRGSYFLEMKSVAPRRLTGEAWGFICPVHTPDGAPCGLLNHLTYSCTIPAIPVSKSSAHICSVLQQLGMVPLTMSRVLAGASSAKQYPVMIDGRLVGHVTHKDSDNIVLMLRTLKTRKGAKTSIYPYTEIVLVKERPHGGQFPGLFIFTSPARFMRPVMNLDLKCVEFVGTFEQMYLNVAIDNESIKREIHSHVELDKTQIFSNIGRMVPFSDCNPNPRNMYQCQMGKQTMGTPLHNWKAQTQNKAYRLQYLQVPLVRNRHYDTIDMQDHCMGFNACLAIISYTGYDIEDAMVINKASMERGLAYGQVYKTEFVDLMDKEKSKLSRGEVTHVFLRDPDTNDDDVKRNLDEIGLPLPGTKLVEGSPYYSVFDVRSRQYRVTRYKGEPCVVDKVALINSSVKSIEPVKVSITIRATRKPTIGDKFASRSGQKGIMSRLYPTEDLPFTERGMMPDIIFNPHGIPSRMTAGKLIEVIAGKAAAEFGLSFDSTPFEFNDENPAAEYFGEFLEKAGFNYYGEDMMYSGIDGRLMEVKIYQGIMYYQRLRHMTEDKYQVRSTGTVDATTHQPVKGRKRGGAIRFGEMERDALISHGAAFTLRDRLLECSDDSQGWACSKCGGLLSARPVIKNPHARLKRTWNVPQCSLCGPEAEMVKIRIPHAFKLLVSELGSLNSCVKIEYEEKFRKK